MSPFNLILKMSRLPQQYQSPLQQIVHFLTLEPTTARSGKISRIQDTFRSLAETLQESQDALSSFQSATSPLEPLPALLPPIYFPSTPQRALPTLTTLPLSYRSQFPSRPNLPPPSLPSAHALYTNPPPSSLSPRSSTATLPPRPLLSPSLSPDPLPTTPLEDTPASAISTTAIRPSTRRSATARSQTVRPAKRRKLSHNTNADTTTQSTQPLAAARQTSRERDSGAVEMFQQQLLQLEITEKKSNQVVTSHINSAFAETLVQFFFKNTFGDPCQTRILQLVDEINEREMSAVPIAEEKAVDPNLLPELREFFSSYTLFKATEKKQDTVQEIAQTIRGYELYRSFVNLKEKAAGEDGEELRAFLEAQGLATQQGRGVQTCILMYLTRVLQRRDKDELSTQLQRYQGVYLLAKQFGKGILVLLPKGATHRIHKFGSQKMQHIVPILFAALPEAVNVCKAAEHLIPYITKHTNVALASLQEPRKACQPDTSLSDTLALFQRVVDAPACNTADAPADALADALAA